MHMKRIDWNEVDWMLWKMDVALCKAIAPLSPKAENNVYVER
jgi:hypothetical protein